MQISKETVELCMAFRDDRDWKQFHNPKDLAVSIVLEASELLELFQWKTSEEGVEKNLSRIKEELADVMVYCLDMADMLGLDPDEIIRKKMEQNAAKYPVEKARGVAKKYTEL